MNHTELQEILTAHRLWRQGDPDGQRADLTGADLTDANLTDANLTDANLTDADLTDANLTDADLTDANLTDANLTDANLTDAYLTGADLERTKLPVGWLWWQGGASGPYRRQMRVWRPGPDAPIVAHQGCIHGSPAEVEAGLRARREAWADDHSDALADLWLAESLAMLAAGVAYVEARAALEAMA